MITVKIMGGLGNQMFQYAFAYAVSKKNHQPIKLDISYFKKGNKRKYELGLFNIDVSLATKKEVETLRYKKRNIFIRTFRKPKKWGLADTYYPEPHFHFDEKALNVKNDVYFDGYWQSEKYFKEYRNELLANFTLKSECRPKTKIYQQQIMQTKSISLHIRRGDYISDAKINAAHGVCSSDYYKNAIAKIKQKITNPHFFIFSDDLPWAKSNFDFIDNKTFVQLENTTPDYEEILLMSLCQHNIIANSSFSWWGAWLNQNPKKQVIAPKKWLNNYSGKTQDLIPDTWVRL